MIVDDDANIRHAARRVLEYHGVEVDEADGVEVATALLRSRTYDIALVDLVLLDGDGTQVINHIKENAPDTPVVCITGYPQHALVQLALQGGVLAVMHKPFTAKELERMIVSFKLKDFYEQRNRGAFWGSFWASLVWIVIVFISCWLMR